MLNTMHAIELNALSLWKEDTHFFNSLVPLRQGLVISVGPTNSGKTTTLHALLHEIAKTKKHKVVSLEDPIEIEDDSYLQLQINESMGFTYDVGIEQLLRHDPDIICIGETRNSFKRHKKQGRHSERLTDQRQRELPVPMSDQPQLQPFQSRVLKKRRKSNALPQRRLQKQMSQSRQRLSKSVPYLRVLLIGKRASLHSQYIGRM